MLSFEDLRAFVGFLYVFYNYLFNSVMYLFVPIFVMFLSFRHI